MRETTKCEESIYHGDATMTTVPFNHLSLWPFGLTIIVLVVGMVITAHYFNLSFSATQKTDSLAKALVVVPVLMTTILCYILATHYNRTNNHENIIATIETTTNVTNLKLLEGKAPICTRDFQGSVQAATWRTGDVSNVGILVGKREENGCVFSLKNIR